MNAANAKTWELEQTDIETYSDGVTNALQDADINNLIATGIMNSVLSALGYSASNISSPALRMAMPWLFIGGETICYLVIFILFLFMKVERFSELDHAAIRLDQDPGATVGEIREDEVLMQFNEMRRRNGKTELHA